MRYSFEHKPMAAWAGRTGFHVASLIAGLALAGCSSMSNAVPKPEQPITVSASLQNDPYPDLRQLTPEQTKQLQEKRQLVNQLSTPGANTATVPQAPSQLVTGSVRPKRLNETVTLQSVPQDQPVHSSPPAVPQQLAAAQPTQNATQVEAPKTLVKPPKVVKKKSGGFFGWLGPISAKRATETTPAQKLRMARKYLASQRQEIDQAQIVNDGTGPVGVVPPTQIPPARVAQVPSEKVGPKPEKTRTALKITKPAKPVTVIATPARVKPKPVRVAKRPVRHPAPRARAIRREPVQVARLGSNSRPVTTASVPTRNAQIRPASKIRADLPTRSRPITVYFSKDSSILSPRDAKRLRELAGLQQSAGKRVHVRAIAAAGPNGEASADANALNKLAVSRAKAVATKLWSFGVKSADMVLQASQEQAAGQGRSTLQAARIRRAEIYIE